MGFLNSIKKNFNNKIKIAVYFSPEIKFKGGTNTMKKLRLFLLVSLSIFLFTSYGLSQAAPVDLNEASVEQLAELPGIGEATAKKIIEYREQNGKFETTEDIMNVKGIGEKKYETLKDLITVSN
jgi:competence protein ComEA